MSKRSLPRRTISAGDHVRLQATARSLADQFHPLAAPLSKAIEQAERLNEDDTRENTVSLNRFVTYKISGSKRPEQRLLVHPEDQMWPPAEISVITPLGLTLLGLSAGECAPLIGACLQGLLWVEVIAVGPSATGGGWRAVLHFGALRQPGRWRITADSIRHQQFRQHPAEPQGV